MTDSFLLRSRDGSQVAAAVKSVLRDENDFSCASFLNEQVVLFFCMFEP